MAMVIAFSNQFPISLMKLLIYTFIRLPGNNHSEFYVESIVDDT